jgi:hypothetical protein
MEASPKGGGTDEGRRGAVASAVASIGDATATIGAGTSGAVVFIAVSVMSLVPVGGINRD